MTDRTNTLAAGLPVLLCAVAALPPTAAGQCPLFADAVSWGTLAGPRCVAAGDLDGDLDLDLAVANELSDTVSILFNDGDGNFTVVSAVSAGDGPRAVAIGKLDGDLDLDLAVVNFLDDTVSILLNNGNGTFAAAVTYAAFDGPGAVAMADLDGDLDLDLAVTNEISIFEAGEFRGKVSILLNLGNEVFAGQALYNAGPDVRSIAVGDVDGMNGPDLAVANPHGLSGSGGTASILANLGNGTFQFINTTAADSGAVSVALADLNGDLDLDLVVADENTHAVSIAFGNGPFTFTNDVTYSAGIGPRSVAVADLDGDDDLDVVAASGGSNDVSVLLNQGNGTFAAALTFAAGNKPSCVVVADLDGDSDPDLAVANELGNDVSVLLNHTVSPPDIFNGVSITPNALQVMVSQVAVLNRFDCDLGSAGVPTTFSAAHLSAQAGDSLVYALFDPGFDPPRIGRFDVRTVAFLGETGLDSLGHAVLTLAVSPYASAHPEVVLSLGDSLATVHLTGPEAGQVRLGPALAFGPPGGSQIDLLAYSPAGILYGVESVGPGQGSRLWKVDGLQAAEFIGTTAGDIYAFDAAAFLGEALWMYSSATGLAVRLSLVDASTLDSAGPYVFGLGLASRTCATLSPVVDARDKPLDTGQQIVLDWSAYAPPGGVVRYDIYRSRDTCELVPEVDSAPLVGSVTSATQQLVDTLAADYDIHFYRIDVVVSVLKPGETGSRVLVDQVAAQLFSGPVWSAPSLVINEFAPAGDVPKPGAALIGEKVELRNLSPDPIDLTGFRLGDGLVSEPLPSTTIAGSGFFVHALATISLPDAGGTLALLAPGTSFVLDSVSYGSEGGAPSVPAGLTISRVAGTDADDPDANSFSASQPTFGGTLGATNSVAPPALGTSILLNEIFYDGGPQQDYVELFNPLATTVVLDQFVLGNGNSFMDTLSIGVSLVPGQIFAVDSDYGVPFVSDITTTQMNLYKITASGLLQRIDQIGWGPIPPAPAAAGRAVVRVPDGNAEYLGDQGTNWEDSGGGSSLTYGPKTPGQPNVASNTTIVVVNQTPGVGGFTTISAALGAVSPGTTILVDPGVYPESIVLASGVKVIGRPTPLEAVVVSGNGLNPVVTANDVDATGLLANVVIQSDSSRGVDASGSFMSMLGVRIVGNHTSGNGAGVRITGGAPRFEGCVFQNNVAGANGGAVEVTAGAPKFWRCLFVGNEAQAGGVLYASGGTPELRQCVLDGNASWGANSGAVHGAGGSVRVLYSALTNSTLGASMRTSGGTVEYNCGLLFNHPGSIPPGDAGVTMTGVVLEADPLYCDPTLMNYAYPESSPLYTLSVQCGTTVGITGPPCGDATATPNLPAPAASRLLSAAPNPFNPRTALRFELAHPGRVDVEIFDLRGRLVARPLHAIDLGAGRHHVTWRGNDRHGRQLASGLYIARMRVDGRRAGEVQRLVLLK